MRSLLSPDYLGANLRRTIPIIEALLSRTVRNFLRAVLRNFPDRTMETILFLRSYFRDLVIFVSLLSHRSPLLFDRRKTVNEASARARTHF